MRAIELTHPTGTTLPVNPLTMVTWAPAEFPDPTDPEAKKIRGTMIAFTDGQKRNVTETIATVTERFNAAVSEYAIRLDVKPVPE